MTVKADWVDGNTVTAASMNAVGVAVNAAHQTPTAVQTAGYSAAVSDFVPCDATGGGFTVTLPSAPADGAVIAVKKLDSSANAVTVQRSGSDVFNVAAGATTLQLTLPDQTVTVQYKTSDGIWYVTGHGTPVAALDARYSFGNVPTSSTGGGLVAAYDSINQWSNTATLNLARNVAVYTHYGATAATWTLPAVASGHARMVLKNGSTALLTVEVQPDEYVYDAFESPALVSVTINPGDSADLICTGSEWIVAGRGVGLPKVMCRLNSSYTLTSSASVQKLFNSSTNGRVTLPLGTYRFRCLYSLSSMSATSGNSAFSLAVGTAVIGTILMQVVGVDGDAATAASLTGSTAVTSAFPASQHTAGTGTAQQSLIEGTFEVTTAGTVIPSVQLVTAAAAVVAAGSFFECWRVGSTTVATVGAWD